MSRFELSSLGYRVTRRVARSAHRCTDCDRTIAPGEVYREVVCRPTYDFNPNPGHWTRGAFCEPPFTFEEAK